MHRILKRDGKDRKDYPKFNDIRQEIILKYFPNYNQLSEIEKDKGSFGKNTF